LEIAGVLRAAGQLVFKFQYGQGRNSFMTKKKLIRMAVIPLAAIFLFWVGGFFYFKSTDDWQKIKILLGKLPEVQEKVGVVEEITLSPFPFSYRFSGDTASAKLNVSVKGNIGKTKFQGQYEKKNGEWVSPPRLQ
jgi:hypothetical protein